MKIIAICLAAFLVAGVASLASADSKIAKHAVMPITQEGYPKLYAAWGAGGVKRINGLMPLAANKVAASTECDKVEYIGISTERSTPTSKIVFFADCANRKRFYIDESDLKSSQTAQSQTSKTAKISDPKAIESCEQSIKSQLTNPMTYNRNFGTTSVYRAPSTGNVVVQFDFEAKNNLGGELPHKARCVITDRGIESAEITKS